MKKNFIFIIAITLLVSVGCENKPTNVHPKNPSPQKSISPSPLTHNPQTGNSKNSIISLGERFLNFVASYYTETGEDTNVEAGNLEVPEAGNIETPEAELTHAEVNNTTLNIEQNNQNQKLLPLQESEEENMTSQTAPAKEVSLNEECNASNYEEFAFDRHKMRVKLDWVRSGLPYTCIFADEVMSDISFKEAYLWSTVFNRAELTNIIFEDVPLENSNFENTVLIDPDFSEADLTNARFINSVIIGGDFTGAILNDARFIGATITDTDFIDVKAERLIMRNAEITNVSFDDAELVRSDWEEATIVNTTFIDTDLMVAKFNGLDLSNKVSFAKSDLRSTELKDTILVDVIFREAKLGESSDVIAAAKEVFWFFVGFPEVILNSRCRNCSGDFPDYAKTYRSAILTGADITRADFTDAIINDVDFHSTKGFYEAIGLSL